MALHRAVVAMTEGEALVMLESLAAVINRDLDLGIDTYTRRRVALLVLEDDGLDDPDVAASRIVHLLLAERTIN
jgi:hypothetical protein